MNKRVDRALEIEVLYIAAKNNEDGALEALYGELLPIFSAWFVERVHNKINNYRLFMQDAEQDFYFSLQEAIKMYDSERGTSFLSYVHFFFQRTINEFYKYINEGHNYYKGLAKVDVETIVLDNELNESIPFNEKSDVQLILESMGEPYKTFLKVKYGFVDITEEGKTVSLTQIAQYLYDNKIVRKKYSVETIRQIQKKSLKIFQKKLENNFF